MRRLRDMLGITTTAAVLVACLAVPAHAMPPVFAPAPQPYVVTGFEARALTAPGVRVTLDPPVPNGYFGWYVTVVRVTLTPERPALVRYVWDDPGGGWLPYVGPLVAPEGKHVLYAQSDDGSSKGPLTAVQVKVDFRSQRARRPVASTSPRPQGMPPASANSAVVRVTASANPWAGPRVIRIGGKDRYETSAMIANPNFTAAPAAIVARGDNFPDALASAGLAGIYDAPIVLAQPTQMPQAVAEALAKLGTTRAILVGNEKAVSRAVETELRNDGFVVERIGGVDRYDTAAMIGEAIVERGGQQGRAFVARGDLYPDSLSVSPYAFRAKRPILLVKPTYIPENSKRGFANLHITSTVIAGSNKAVSDDVAADIARMTGSTPQRCEGIDRYATAIQAARYGVQHGLGSFKFVGIATGQNFPDALCGGAAVGHQSGVILMTPKAYLYPAVGSELASNGASVRDIQVYGSEAAVSKAAYDAIIEAVR